VIWDGTTFAVKSGEIFKQIRLRKNTRGYDKSMVRLKRLELRKNGGYDIKATTNAAPFLLCAEEVVFRKMFLRVRDPREDSKRIAYGESVKAVVFEEIEENGRHPFLQLEICAQKITAKDSKLILQLDQEFRSAPFLRELNISNCTWGPSRHQKTPLQVHTILELLGPNSKLEKITLKINDEKLKCFEIMINRLRYLREAEIIFPENTQLLELSDLFDLGHVG
jgi:hypothetical protein